ncbi:MAG: polyamine aminopropyltransferase, partial [Pseudomonadota bacterium]
MSLNETEWFVEAYEDQTAFAVRYTKELVDQAGPFQRIQVFQSTAMGRVLILNGCFMVTEKDAFIYHEMLVHPAMRTLTRPKRVLIIGGGDGGAVTEAVKYPGVESVTLCEIDKMVVDCCRDHFPEISRGLDDPRVKTVYDDGAAFVRNHEGYFDLIMVDSTDPVGPAQALYETDFYQAVKRGLTSEGIAVFQTESPLFMPAVFAEAEAKLKSVFGGPAVRPYFAVIPCYPGGLWSFTMC